MVFNDPAAVKDHGRELAAEEFSGRLDPVRMAAGFDPIDPDDPVKMAAAFDRIAQVDRVKMAVEFVQSRPERPTIRDRSPRPRRQRRAMAARRLGRSSARSHSRSRSVERLARRQP